MKNDTYYETENQLEEIQRDKTFTSLILIVLSHGKSRNHFYCTDGKLFDFVDIQIKFADTLCPSLKGKPKILMGSFCRGKDIELVSDSGP